MNGGGGGARRSVGGGNWLRWDKNLFSIKNKYNIRKDLNTLGCVLLFRIFYRNSPTFIHVYLSMLKSMWPGRV